MAKSDIDILAEIVRVLPPDSARLDPFNQFERIVVIHIHVK